VEITFPLTSGANNVTTITPIDPASAGTTPGGFVVGDFAYEISTTANFTPPVEVCISLHHLIEPSMAQFNAYKFMHSENGVLVDRTSRHDFFNRLVCGSLTSFSPVALMKQVDPTLPTISGLVLDENGEPMDDVAVTISDNEIPVKTNHLGQFEFANLKPNGNYSVQIFKSGYLFSPPFQNFLDLTADETVVFTATAASFDIGGVAVDGDGTPISGVTVKLSGARDAEVVTGADGAFTFPDLPANAEYRVLLIPNTPGTFSPPEFSVDTLQSDLTGLVFTQFAPTAAGVSVGGRLTTADGFGISGAILVLTARDGSKQEAITGPFGYYRFDDVQVGETYFLEVNHKRYQFNGSPRVLRVLDEVTDINFVGLLRDDLDRFR
jgi:hypothetical protein